MTFHDPLVAACLFEPDLCDYQRGRVEVDFMQERKLGMMSFRESAEGRHEIASTVDRTRFFEHYFSVVCG